jgi:hypothetical protein
MTYWRISACFVTGIALALATSGAQPGNTAKPEHEGFHLSDLLPRSLQRNPKLEISILTELTPDGKKITAPDSDHPTYYALWDGGLVEAGDTVAGERPPKKEQLAAMMERALASSGYLPATKEHPPTLVIHYRWGSYNHLTSLDTSDPSSSSGEGDETSTSTDAPSGDDLTDPMVRKNLFTRAALVGGPKFAQELLHASDLRLMDQFRLKDPRNEDLVEMALGDLYFVVAVGYDGEAARLGKAKPLWTTKISTNSQGLSMDDTVPALASNGRRLFGHETDGPVLAEPRLFGGKVEVGEPFVVKDGGDAATPTPPSKPTAPAK